MTATFLAIWIFAFALGGTAIGALIWAVKSGQFNKLSEGSRIIFDDDEPEGVVNDRFPSLSIALTIEEPVH